MDQESESLQKVFQRGCIILPVSNVPIRQIDFNFKVENSRGEGGGRREYTVKGGKINFHFFLAIRCLLKEALYVPPKTTFFTLSLSFCHF